MIDSLHSFAIGRNSGDLKMAVFVSSDDISSVFLDSGRKWRRVDCSWKHNGSVDYL